MEYEYDSWGRMLAMTYPDGERVSYSYDRGGNLYSMSGVKNSVPYKYINSVIYDRYGNRSRIEHGNLSHTEYTYDDLQRLTRLKTYAYNSGNEALIQDIAYTFDNVGNITDAANNATAFGTLGGVYSNSYSYDAIDRLTSAFQSYGSGNTLATEYSSSGRLCSRSQTFSSQASIFGYDVNIQPHAPRRVLDSCNMTLHDIMWDMNGNMAMVNEYVTDGQMAQSSRSLFWTEDNRLHTVADERHFSYYTYDYSGERTLKMTGDAYDVDQNAREQYLFASLNNITIYPSPYTVVSNQGYTKHYYAGAERVAARLGGGGLGYDTACISHNPEVSRCADSLFQHVLKSVSSYEYQKQDGLDVVRIDGSVLGEASGFNGDNFPIRLNADVRAEPWRLNRIIEGLSDSVNPIVIDSSYEPDVYFYHSDHLGSASWITDAEGIPVQHLQLYYHARFSSTRSTGACTTFGEPFVNQRISGYQRSTTKDGAATHKAPLRGPLDLVPFTGKERDAETGYSYFGARYYDNDLSGLFMSVDPMSDKYPNVSPLNTTHKSALRAPQELVPYCAWNPVRLIDPNGCEIGDYYNYLGEYLGSDNENDHKVYVATKKNEDGTFENAKDLGVTHEEFCTIANIVKHESSHGKDEDLWIAHTANNAAKKSKKKMYEKLMSGYSSVKKDNKTPLESSDNSPCANSARAAVIDVLIGGFDPTGGASLWDGIDFLAKGSSQAKFRQYTSITIDGNIYNTYLNNSLARYKSGRVRLNNKSYSLPADVFTNMKNWSDNTFQYTTGAQKATKAIKATGAIGNSIFWKVY